MRVVEHSYERLVIERRATLDRLLFWVAILIGITAFFWIPADEGPAWFKPIFVTLFVGVGSIFLLLCADLILTLDRPAGVAQIDWVRSIRGTKTQAVHLSQIAGVGTEGDDEAARLVFRLKNGEKLPLVPFLYTGGGHPKIQRAITAWLAEQN